MLAPMLLLGHGYRIRESGLFSFHGLSTELALAALGVVVATFWYADPWLIPFAVAPVLLIHRSLSVPELEAEARVDPKTGLFNARHFGAALNEEIVRSARFDRPLALIMADLDLLRDINNTYGHLAGDAVLQRRSPMIFRSQLRHYDVAGPLRRRGVQHPAARDRCLRRRWRSPSGFAARSPIAHSTSRPPASRSARRSRSAWPPTRATARTRTS